jgi:hypothetical protein
LVASLQLLRIAVKEIGLMQHQSFLEFGIHSLSLLQILLDPTFLYHGPDQITTRSPHWSLQNQKARPLEERRCCLLRPPLNR